MKSKKIAIIILSLSLIIVLSGCNLLNQLSGKSNTMVTYLEDTYDAVNEYLVLLDKSNALTDWEEWTEFTENEFFTKMNGILQSLRDVGEEMSNEELLAIHNLLVESVEKEVAAHQAWLDEEYDTAEILWEEASELHYQHDTQIDELANSWGVTIDWEETE
ncbi:hypothetical protein [Bacillus horti]|uniref:Uncharacterized protein n=1 Tax=Caldalkalibacillus horti TaxID=77523 RepID=A0ABT9VZM3_9BACI|nr:hypothetical protein [Bacillus horti]MDQ0166262.1 hypothetical protein [Bacillus horti]